MGKKSTPQRANIHRGKTYKQRPEFRGAWEHVVVFYSPCCGCSMHVIPALKLGREVEYPRFLRCRKCHRFWKITLLFTRRRNVRSVRLEA